MTKTWFITGANRGIGAEIASAALAAGDRVVVTGRSRQACVDAFGPDSDRVLTLSLDVTDAGQIAAAVEAAVAHFGRIDVLVNNAGYGHLGMFEETAEADIRAQFETNVFGLFAVTRAVLPVMRRQRSGHVFNLSSLAGQRGGATASIYCATKFAVEGFSESLADEVKGFGIKVTIIEPGFFRTDFLDASSVRLSDAAIEDYAETWAAMRAFFEGRSHNQAGDPARLADIVVRLAGEAEPPLRFCAGTDAVNGIQGKIDLLQRELDRYRDLSVSTDGDFEFAEEKGASAWG